MIIREATNDDLVPLLELFGAYRIFYGHESGTKAESDFLIDRLSGMESQIFLAENEDGRITGFVQLYPLYSSTRLKRLWLLNDLFVIPEFRGQGISKKLIERSKILCRQTKACGLMLETAKTNEIGNNLYISTGFQLDSEHNYYTWDT